MQKRKRCHLKKHQEADIEMTKVKKHMRKIGRKKVTVKSHKRKTKRKSALEAEVKDIKPIDRKGDTYFIGTDLYNPSGVLYARQGSKISEDRAIGINRLYKTERLVPYRTSRAKARRKSFSKQIQRAEASRRKGLLKRQFNTYGLSPIEKREITKAQNQKRHEWDEKIVDAYVSGELD